MNENILYTIIRLSNPKILLVVISAPILQPSVVGLGLLPNKLNMRLEGGRPLKLQRGPIWRVGGCNKQIIRRVISKLAGISVGVVMIITLQNNQLLTKSPDPPSRWSSG